MEPMTRSLLGALSAVLFSLPWAGADEAPDGTQFAHRVIAVDGPDLVRVWFCGIPVQVRLANVQLKGSDAESECLKYLKETLKSGAPVKLDVEPELAGEAAPPPAQLFAGSTHINVELVKRGLAVSDGRSRKYGTAMQTAQLDAMTKKRGVWAAAEKTEPVVAAARPASSGTGAALTAATSEARAVVEAAPAGYSGPVVADLSSKEYHFPGSRYASNIRAGAKIEYKSPAEAERAGKAPSPFSFPERARALAESESARGASLGSAKILENARKAFAEALTYMQEARRESKSNTGLANEIWQKAAKLLTEQLDRVIPIADADPNNRELQQLTEDMSMNLYSCKKYQTL